VLKSHSLKVLSQTPQIYSKCMDKIITVTQSKDMQKLFHNTIWFFVIFGHETFKHYLVFCARIACVCVCVLKFYAFTINESIDL
jgi:hypothetical protein